METSAPTSTSSPSTKTKPEINASQKESSSFSTRPDTTHWSHQATTQINTDVFQLFDDKTSKLANLSSTTQHKTSSAADTVSSKTVNTKLTNSHEVLKKLEPSSKSRDMNQFKDGLPYLPSISDTVLYIPKDKFENDKVDFSDPLSSVRRGTMKPMLNFEMKALPENGFSLHSIVKNLAKIKPEQSPQELPSVKLSRVNSGVRYSNAHRKMNLDKLRDYIKDIRQGPSVIVPKQGLYTPKVEIANHTERADESVGLMPSPVERYGSPYNTITGVSTVFTRYWPAVLGVTIGTIFLLTALITSILCRQRRLLVQRARWVDSPQHLSEPPDTSEYATSSAASLTSDLTRSSVNLVSRNG
ncbi:uncharacterized protein LOC131931056 [Physella acuta]|uniref:uncharacterized protein LOC131931056 n=1 Tax=Physella acuta TaxID=109671 RepID=UPI0027DC660C|nr:uncharacterized protein LOC131931056 [Physella acuta]